MSYYACNCDTSLVPSLSITELCPGSQYASFMSLVDLVIRYACFISDPCNRVTPKFQPAEEYDFIVIGGGSGGSTIAGRLAEISNWTTLLIEAGMDEPPATQIPILPAFSNTEIDWNFTTQPEAVACLSSGGICPWPRGKVLGGTSVFNGMFYIRGTPVDYQKWVDAGNTEWSYDDLLPVFKASEGNKQVGSLVDAYYHGTEGPFTIQQWNYRPTFVDDMLVAVNQSGWPISNDLNGKDYVGFSVAQFNNRNGVRLSLAKAFVRPHKDNKNFDVMINSTVTRILVSGDGENKRAIGVELVYNNVTYTVKARKEVILAAGVVQTPQILMLSGIGPTDELNKFGIELVHELPGVGKGLKDHVAFIITGTFNQLDLVDLNNDTLYEYLTTQGGPLSSTLITQVTARIPSNYTTPDNPDIQYFLRSSNTCAYSGECGLPVDPADPTALRTLEFFLYNNHPKSSGYISLLSNNPFDPPKIVANYLTHPDDVKVLINALRIVQDLVKAPIMQEKYNFTWTKSSYGNCSTDFEYDSDEFWDCAIRYGTASGYHPTSSCKLAPQSNPEACLNQRLQLYGIPNIRIADGSALYDVPSGNTQATIVAIAERAYQFIKEDYLGN